MKKLVVTSLALSAALVSHQALAGGMKSAAPAPIDHFYGQIEGGYAQLDTRTNLIPAQSTDKGGFAYGARVGYASPLSDGWNWGLELGYFNFGETKYNNIFNVSGADVEIKQQGADLLAVISKDFNNGLSAFGKAGIAYVDQNVDFKVYNNPAFTNYSALETRKVLPEIAGGLGYQVSQNLAVTGTVAHTFGKNLNSNSASTDVSSATAALVGLRLNLG